MSRLHEPTPEFRARLESRIVREYRRSSRRMTTAGMRRAAVVAAAIALGALAGAVPAQVQQSQTRSSLLEAARAEQELIQLRYELARREYELQKTRYDVGALTRASLLEAEAGLRAMEMALRRNQLRQEEIQATAAPPRDDISAPLVGGRDFVSERVQLDLAAAEERLAAAERNFEDVRRRMQIGTSTPAEQLEAEAELARARHEMELLGTRLSVRREFVSGDVGVPEIERRLQEREIMVEIALAERLHELAEQRLANMRQLRAAGTIDQVELLRTEVEVIERTMELQRLSQRLEALRQGR